MLRLNKYISLIFTFLFITVSIAQDNVFNSYDLLRTKYVVETSISPDGSRIAFTLHVPKQLEDSPGKHYRYLYHANDQRTEQFAAQQRSATDRHTEQATERAADLFFVNCAMYIAHDEKDKHH